MADADFSDVPKFVVLEVEQGLIDVFSSRNTVHPLTGAKEPTLWSFNILNWINVCKELEPCKV